MVEFRGGGIYLLLRGLILKQNILIKSWRLSITFTKVPLSTYTTKIARAVPASAPVSRCYAWPQFYTMFFLLGGGAVGCVCVSLSL